MSISFNGIGRQMLTFYATGVTASSPVKMVSSQTVSNCAVSNDFIGVAINCRGEFAGVQTEGYVEMPYTGTAPVLGFTGLTANGSGGVKADTAAAKKYKVITVDTAKKLVGFII